MNNFLNTSAKKLFVAMLFSGLGLLSHGFAQDQPTIQNINSINGFHDSMAAIERSFQKAFDEIPNPKPEKLVEAWAIASEDAFDAGKLITAVDAEMEGRLTIAELRELHEYFLSPFGSKVSALESAAAKIDYTQAKIAEGERLFRELAAKDPDRLALYKRMLDGLEAVDVTEAVTLNMIYAMTAAMIGAAGAPVTDEQMLAIVRQATVGLRQTLENVIHAQTALSYRDLTNEELQRYVEFLETPAGLRYYELMQQAFDKVLGKEAREFGNQLFKAMGTRKA